MFITFEGIEGSGKSTMMALLANHMRNKGDTPLVTREPGEGHLGRRLRSLLLDSRQEHISAVAELFLFLADRAQHMADVIRPALDAGQSVICDRFTDSTLAYQGYGRGMNVNELRQMNRIATAMLKPDLTLLLDLRVSDGLARAGERNRAEGTVISEGRFDSESIHFHNRVRKGYLELAEAEPDRFRIIDASRAPEHVFQDCVNAYEQLKERSSDA